ncbi:hypothetical protein ACIQTZ_18550 [Paenarthrobacter sp. NPDC090520]|uniref:hypothetical protein n=1 Tax=unclassified Paenarthrobacter TaxID=2634190 RepID=UPI003801AAF9
MSILEGARRDLYAPTVMIGRLKADSQGTCCNELVRISVLWVPEYFGCLPMFHDVSFVEHNKFGCEMLHDG